MPWPLRRSLSMVMGAAVVLVTLAVASTWISPAPTVWLVRQAFCSARSRSSNRAR